VVTMVFDITGILLDLIMVVLRTINYHIFGSYVHKGMGKVNFLGENLSNGDKIKVKFKWIFCHPKQKKFNKFCNIKVKYLLGYAPLWLHHPIEKKQLDKGASLGLECSRNGIGSGKI